MRDSTWISKWDCHFCHDQLTVGVSPAKKASLSLLENSGTEETTKMLVYQTLLTVQLNKMKEIFWITKVDVRTTGYFKGRNKIQLKLPV